MRETDRWRAMASYEFFLVREGERWGMAGASVSLGDVVVDGGDPAALK